MERRKRIIEISNRYRLAVIEEDAASELVYSGAKFLPIKAYDTLNNVIYIYSFSLTFMPGLSLAFVVADQTLIERLSYLVSVRLVSSDWLAQKLIARYLGDGSYYQVLTKFRENYALKQELICRKLDQMKIMGVEYERPRGGVYIWCKLPEGIDSKKLVDAAYQKGISILPGYVFYPMKNGGRDYIRLNYSYESSERLLLGMDILKDTIRKELAHKK
jgi:DNA-binding transcriptional MocR family regulator